MFLFRNARIKAQLQALIQAATEGRYAEAVRIGEAFSLPANADTPAKAVYNFMLGVAYIETERFDDALPRLRAAEQYNRGWDSTREEQSKVQSRIAEAYIGKWWTTGQSDRRLLEQARDAMDAAIRLLPGNSDLLEARAFIATNLGQAGR